MARLFNGNAANYLSSTLQYDLPANWTILFRVKNVVNNASHQIIMGRRGGDGNGWAIGRFDSGAFTFWAFGATGAVSVGSIAAGSGAFDAYALTRESTGSVGTFYKNSTTPLGTAAITTVATTGAGLSVGAFNDAGANSFPANCELAEIAIFSRVLNSTELGQWFSGDSPSLYNTGLVHYWKLDAASGNESATTGGTTLTQVGTVASTTHPAMNYGGSGTDGTGTGSPTALSLTVPTATAAGTGNPDGTGAGAPTSLTLTVPSATATGTSSGTDGTGSGAPTAMSMAAPSASATGTTSGSGTLVTPVLKNNTGTVLASETGITVNVYDATTGALVLHKTGQTSNGSGIVTVIDAALTPATTYAYEVVLSGGARRLPTGIIS